jgi:leucyl aminopeptidase
MRSGWERQCWNALRDVEVDVRTDREIKRIHDATGHDTTEDEWDLLQSRYKKEVEDEANTASGRARRDLEKPYVARRVSYIEWRGQQPSQRHKSVVSWARRIHHKLARQIEDQERTRRQEEQKIRLEETTAAVAETVAMRRSLVVISKLSRELQEMPSQQQIPEQLAAAGEGQNIRWLQLSDLARTREIIVSKPSTSTKTLS